MTEAFPEWIIDAIHRAEYVHVDEDLGALIAWHGAGIFNVYRLSDGYPCDCWTTDGVPGPTHRESDTAWSNSVRASHGAASQWAKAECEEYLARMTEDVDA